MKKIIASWIACLGFLSFAIDFNTHSHVEKSDPLSNQAYFQWGIKYKL